MDLTPSTEILLDAHGRQLCPYCGHPNAIQPRLDADEVLCNHRECPGWSNTGVYDHVAGTWLPVNADGYVPDGRHSTVVE